MTYKEGIIAAAAEALPWERLEGKNILIAGATGLIGSCLVDILMSRVTASYKVFASGRNAVRAHERFAQYSASPRFHFLQHDVCQPLSCNETFHYIVHAASGAGPASFANTPVEVVKANILGVSNLMDYGLSHGMERMLYVSTGEIYGEGGATVATEAGMAFGEHDSGYVDCATQRACYPSSKRAAETLCMAYRGEYGADVVIARPCHVYGPNFTEADNRVFAQFMRNAMSGEDIIMKSDGSQFRSWCHVIDCARGLLYIMLKGRDGEAYNVADEASCMTIRQLAERIAAAHGRKVVMQIPPDNERRGYNVVTRSIFSTLKLRDLGWEAHHSLC